MDFHEYLHSKKIDSDAFKKANSSQWHEWKSVFDQVHPKSFTSQRLFLINPLRRQFPYDVPEEVKEKKAGPQKPVIKPKKETDSVEEDKASMPKVKPKPVMKPKPKVAVKPKIPAKPDAEKKEAESKPKFKPRPVVKKRPKTD